MLEQLVAQCDADFQNILKKRTSMSATDFDAAIRAHIEHYQRILRVLQKMT